MVDPSGGIVDSSVGVDASHGNVDVVGAVDVVVPLMIV